MKNYSTKHLWMEINDTLKCLKREALSSWLKSLTKDGTSDVEFIYVTPVLLSNPREQ